MKIGDYKINGKKLAKTAVYWSGLYGMAYLASAGVRSIWRDPTDPTWKKLVTIGLGYSGTLLASFAYGYYVLGSATEGFLEFDPEWSDEVDPNSTDENSEDQGS